MRDAAVCVKPLGTFVLLLSAAGCAPECEAIDPAPQSICHRGETIVPDASFVVEASGPVYGGGCEVRIDGGQIELTLAGVTCSRTSSGGSLRPAVPKVVQCTIPALAVGAYTVNTPGNRQLNVASSGDSGVPPCL